MGYCWALPHSGQNLAGRGTGFPQLRQNFVADSVPAGAAAAGPATGGVPGAPPDTGFIAFIMLWAIVRPAPKPTPIPAAPPPSFPAAMGMDCATWNCVYRFMSPTMLIPMR